MNSTQKQLTEKADAAFRATIATVVERAKLTGTPIIVWDEGRIIERSSDHWEQHFVQPVIDESTS